MVGVWDCIAVTAAIAAVLGVVPVCGFGEDTHNNIRWGATQRHSDITSNAFKEFRTKSGFKHNPCAEETVTSGNRATDEHQLYKPLVLGLDPRRNYHYHFLGERFDAGKKALNDKLKAVQAANPDMCDCNPMFELGIATHIIQDFYAHTNWLEMGKTSTAPLFDDQKSEWDDIKICAGDVKRCTKSEKLPETDTVGIAATDCLTSAYGTVIVHYYCTHGGHKLGYGKAASLFTNDPWGINKDMTQVEPGTRVDLHQQAASLAKLATIELLNRVFCKGGHCASTTYDNCRVCVQAVQDRGVITLKQIQQDETHPGCGGTADCSRLWVAVSADSMKTAREFCLNFGMLEFYSHNMFSPLRQCFTLSPESTTIEISALFRHVTGGELPLFSVSASVVDVASNTTVAVEHFIISGEA